MSKRFGISGKEKLPFHRKKPPTELGSGRGCHLLQLVLGLEEEDRTKTLLEESYKLIITNIKT